MAGSATIGALRVTLGLDSAQFNDGLTKSEARMRKFDRSAQGMATNFRGVANDIGVGGGAIGNVLGKIGSAGLVAGVGIGAAVVAFQGMKAALTFADDLAATATKIGITAEQFQELTFAAKENDITTEALSQSLQGLNIALGAYKAGVGDAKVKKVFEALGITPESLKDVKNAADFLPLLADKIRGLGSAAERVKIAKMLGVEDLVPLLQKGGAEIDALAQKARDLGMVMSNELAAEAADAHRTLEVMGDYISSHLNIAFANMGVWIVDVTKKLGPLIERMKDYLNISTAARKKYLDAEIAAAENSARLRAGSVNPAFRGQAAGYLERARVLKAERAALEPAASTSRGPAAPVVPTEINAGGGGGGRSRARGAAAKPRYAGLLPDYITAAIAEGRFTDESIREAFPDGNFPLPLSLAEDLITASGPAAIEGAYDASERSRGQANGMVTSEDRMNDATAAIEATKDQNREAFREMFSSGLLAALYDGKDGVREWMRQGAERGLEQALNNLADLLFDLFAKSGGGLGNSVGGGILGAIGSIFGMGGGSPVPGFATAHAAMGGGSPVPGFATGGSFTVGGSGGTDSKLVQFRATPGEMVDIRKPGNDNEPGGFAVHVTPSPYFDVAVERVARPIARAAAVQAYDRSVKDSVAAAPAAFSAVQAQRG